MDEIFLINETPNRFRWISLVENGKDWGIRLAQLRGQPVPDFGPIEVKWAPETLDREKADFVYFRPNLKCMTFHSANKLVNYFGSSGQWITLLGLDYKAFYCCNVIDAVDECRTAELQLKEGIPSFHSPTFAPILNVNKVRGAKVFHVPQSISKTFVNAEFKCAYEDMMLTGLDFFPVPVM